MTPERECLHGLTVGTCSICKDGPTQVATQSQLKPSAIAEAVEALGAVGEFTTIDVATHPAVANAHGQLATHSSFNQLIGSFLTESWGTLGIEQVSDKKKSNATWRSTGAST